MFEGKIRPKVGSPSIFSPELEEDFALFIKHCDLLRIPRTRPIFRQDVVHYVENKELTIPRMSENGPG